MITNQFNPNIIDYRGALVNITPDTTSPRDRCMTDEQFAEFDLLCKAGEFIVVQVDTHPHYWNVISTVDGSMTPGVDESQFTIVETDTFTCCP